MTNVDPNEARGDPGPDAPQASPQPPPAAPARRLGPYAIIRPLGHGGMASVYEAVHIGLGKRVAIKVMQAHLTTNETTSARFVREGRAVAKVRHAHVVDVFDVGSHEGTPYLVMELLEGLDLHDYLKVHGRLSLSETIEIMLPVCSAVAAAHDAGIVHRDLKPANVFLAKGRHGRVHPKVVDFGISTFMEKDGDLDLTQTATMLGTVKYMSPEQTRGAKYADARSDQYSLGVMLYLCTTGEAPYLGEGVYETIHAIRNAPFVPPSRLNPALPKTFDDVVARAMMRDPSARFPSVAELGRALLPFAPRRSSAGWEREFAAPDDGGEPKPDPAVRAAITRTDEPTVMTSVTQSEHVRRSRRVRTLVVAGIACAAVAALGAVVVLPRALSHGSPKGRDESTSSASAPMPPAPPASTLEPPPATALPPPSATAPATPTASAKASASAPAPRPAAPPAPKPRRPAAPPTATGNNGAPILD